MTDEKKKEQKKSEEIKKKLQEGKVERAESWPEPPKENNKKSDDS